MKALLISFFIGLIVIGLMITCKAPRKKIMNLLLLALMFVTVIAGFIFISGFVHTAFNLFLLGGFFALSARTGAFSCINDKSVNLK